MNRIFEQIREQLATFPDYEDIRAGKVSLRCHTVTRNLHRHLDGKIPGLSLMQVATVEMPGYIQGGGAVNQQHGWLAAHHPETGYFYIDPTAGQYLYDRKEKDPDNPRKHITHGFNDVFIGTEAELMQLGQERFGKSAADMLLFWSPVVVPADHIGEGTRNLQMDVRETPVWKDAPFKLLNGVYQMVSSAVRRMMAQLPQKKAELL